MILRFAPLALLLCLASSALAQTEQILAPTGVQSQDRVGQDVALDGDRLLVGSPGDNQGAGSALVFDYANGAWTQSATLAPPAAPGPQASGYALDLDGDRAVVAAPVLNNYTGAVYVYDLTGQTWSLTATLTASDAALGQGFGWSVGLDGDRIVVGAPGDDNGLNNTGALYVFDLVSNTWTETAKLRAASPVQDGTLGYGVDVSGDRIIGGAPVGLATPGTGQAHIFEKTPTGWTEYVIADGIGGDRFGEAVSIDGPLAVVGAYRRSVNATHDGAAFVYEQIGNPWVQTAQLDGTNAHDSRGLGYDVDLNGTRIAIGAPSSGVRPEPGSVFVYDLDTSWTLTSRLTASDATTFNLYGISASASGPHVAAGATSADTYGTDSGAAYAYTYGTRAPFLLASGAITIGKASALEGDVHANATLTLNRQSSSYSGSYEGDFTASGAITIDRHNNVGGSVTAGGGLSVHPTATVAGTATGNATVAPISLPTIPVFTAGTQNRTVQSNQSLTLAPGAYRTVRVRDGATLTLTAGTYDVDKLLLNRYSSVVFDVSAGPITVNAATKLAIAADVTTEVAGVSGPDPLLSDQVTLNTAQTLDFSVGARSTLAGSVVAPNAIARIRSDASFRGSLAAAEIRLANRASAVSHGSPVSSLVASSHTPEADVATPEAKTAGAAGDMRLSAAPNPVISVSTVTFSLAEAAEVSLTVHDLLGREVAALASGTYAEGEHRARFDASALQSGVYVVRLATPEAVAVQRVTVVR